VGWWRRTVAATGSAGVAAVRDDSVAQLETSPWVRFLRENRGVCEATTRACGPRGAASRHGVNFVRDGVGLRVEAEVGSGATSATSASWRACWPAQPRSCTYRPAVARCGATAAAAAAARMGGAVGMPGYDYKVCRRRGRARPRRLSFPLPFLQQRSRPAEVRAALVRARSWGQAGWTDITMAAGAPWRPRRLLRHGHRRAGSTPRPAPPARLHGVRRARLGGLARDAVQRRHRRRGGVPDNTTRRGSSSCSASDSGQWPPAARSGHTRTIFRADAPDHRFTTALAPNGGARTLTRRQHLANSPALVQLGLRRR
jgi:hypothetical protein